MSTRFVISAALVPKSTGRRNRWKRKQKGEVDGFLFSNPFLFSWLFIVGSEQKKFLLRFNDCFLTPSVQLSASLSTVRRRIGFLTPLVVACTEHRPPGKSVSTQIFVYRFSSTFILVDFESV